jgi:membrane protease YdiL (CAAX protease family)
MTDQQKNVLFVACTYTFCWTVLIVAVVLISAGAIPSEGVAMEIVTVLGSWTPTIALLVLFKKLYPGGSVLSFYKNAFKARINWRLLVVVTVFQLLSFICTISLVASAKGVALFNLLDLSWKTLGLGCFWTLSQGATGEESGWRGFLQQSLEKHYSVIQSSVIVGTIWAFWHLPLWFFAGYAGIQLLQYSMLFSIWVIAGSVIMGICYSHCRNLFVPVWIHFMFNFCMSVFTGDALDALNAITYLTVLYALAAVGYVAWFKRSRRVKMRTK